MRRLLLSVFAVLLAVPTVAQGDAGRLSPFYEGMAVLEGGDAATAAQLLARAVEDDPQHADAHYGLALAHAAPGPQHDERRVTRHLNAALRLAPDTPHFLEARLDALRRTLPEHRAYSLSDTRRPTLARRILELDPGSVLAHEELALSAFLEFGWRRSLAQRTGGWDRTATRGRSGSANDALARAHRHLDAALARDPANARVHRLRLRVLAGSGDDGGLAEAARAFASVRPNDPAAALYRGLAAQRLDDPDAADYHFDRALAALSADERAAFESLDRFLNDDEQEAYAADSAGFVERFWGARDPRLLSGANERRLAHYARLALADLLYADADQRGWETPRGEVVVRYGLPDADGAWLANNTVARDFGAYEVWAYGDPDADGFTVLFEDAFRNGDYDFPSSAAGEDEATRVRGLFNRRPDRFVYVPPGRVGFPALSTTFKGKDGRTDLVVPFGIPLSAASETAPVAAGLFLLDDAETVAEARQDIARLDAGARTDDGALWTGGLTLAAAPGDYTYAVEFEQKRTGVMGFERASVTLPSYKGGGLQLSSLLPALLVEEDALEEGGAASPGRLRRGPFVIQPAPEARFAVGAPVYLYAEAYGLTVRDGRTAYSVEAVLEPVDDAGALARAARFLLGRRPAAGVSVRFEANGDAADDAQYVILDTARQAPGRYTLTLRLTDLATGATAASSQALTLD